MKYSYIDSSLYWEYLWSDQMDYEVKYRNDLGEPEEYNHKLINILIFIN